MYIILSYNERNKGHEFRLLVTNDKLKIQSRHPAQTWKVDNRGETRICHSVIEPNMIYDRVDHTYFCA